MNKSLVFQKDGYIKLKQFLAREVLEYLREGGSLGWCFFSTNKQNRSKSAPRRKAFSPNHEPLARKRSRQGIRFGQRLHESPPKLLQTRWRPAVPRIKLSIRKRVVATLPGTSINVYCANGDREDRHRMDSAARSVLGKTGPDVFRRSQRIKLGRELENQ